MPRVSFPTLMSHRARKAFLVLFGIFWSGLAGAQVENLRSDQKDLAAAIRGEVDAALRSATSIGNTSIEGQELTTRLGTAPFLQPFLAEHFKHAVEGSIALRHVARLRTVDVEALAEDLARGGRTDDTFLDEAAAVVRSRCPQNALPGYVERLEVHPGVGARLVGRYARRQLGWPATGLPAALASRELAEARFALRHLTSGKSEDARAIGEALRLSTLNPSLRGEALAALLSGPSTNLPAVLEMVLGDESLLAVALTVPLDAHRRRPIVAELATREGTPDTDRWLANLLGRPRETPHRELCATVVTDPTMVEALKEAALGPSTGDAEREQARRLVPMAGLLLTDPIETSSLAKLSRPCHVPYLLANVQVAEFPVLGDLATALLRWGHPEGRAIFQRAVTDANPRRRIAALRFVAAAQLEGGESLLREALADQDPDVRHEALSGLSRSGSSLDPATAVGMLAWTDPLATEYVLDALTRHAEPESGWEAVSMALSQGAVASPEPVACWWVARPWPRRSEVLVASLGHSSPEVRAWAVHGLGAFASKAGMVRVLDRLEGLTRDPSTFVRAHLATALGARRHDLARASLVLLSRDPSSIVREWALLGLGCQEPFHVIPVLRAATRDADPHCANAARLALLRQGVRDELSGLLDAVDDPIVGRRTRLALSSLVKVPCHSADDFRRELSSLVRDGQ